MTLTSFSILGQGALFAASPILTRLFSVEAFGQLAVLHSFSAVFLYAAAGRYEVALLLPREQRDAAALFYVAVLSVCGTSLITGAVYLALAIADAFAGGFAFLAEYGWIVALTQWCGGLYLCLSHLAMRNKALGRLAWSKVTSPCGTLTCQLGLGLAGGHAIGLFLGEPVGLLMRALPLSSEWPRRTEDGALSWRILGTVARQYIEYPLYGTWGILLGSMGRYMLPTLLLALYGAGPAGYYAIITRVISAPLDLIGRSYTEAFLSEASAFARTDAVRLKRLFLRSAVWLFMVGLVPGVLLLCFGPTLFAVVLGAQWRDAGALAQHMAVMIPFSFVNYPLVHIPNILGRPRWQSCWDAIALVVGPGGLIVAYLARATYLDALSYYAIAMTVMFASHFGMSLRAVNLRLAASRDGQTPGRSVRRKPA